MSFKVYDGTTGFDSPMAKYMRRSKKCLAPNGIPWGDQGFPFSRFIYGADIEAQRKLEEQCEILYASSTFYNPKLGLVKIYFCKFKKQATLC